eukprot:ANDGO_03173.mRNA.1 hypothetical protein
MGAAGAAGAAVEVSYKGIYTVLAIGGLWGFAVVSKPFFQSWISSNMDKHIVRDAEMRRNLTEVKAKADALVRSWDHPGRPDHFWKDSHVESKFDTDRKIQAPESAYARFLRQRELK